MVHNQDSLRIKLCGRQNSKKNPVPRTCPTCSFQRLSLAILEIRALSLWVWEHLLVESQRVLNSVPVWARFGDAI